MMILKKNSNPAAKVRAGVTPFGGGDYHHQPRRGTFFSHSQAGAAAILRILLPEGRSILKP
jgi:hypothetical protein